MDAAVTALNGPIELWWNRSPQGNPVHHWLQLRLTGRKSNRSAIGAEVRLSLIHISLNLSCLAA